MIKNRPSLALVPQINKVVLGRRFALNIFAFTSFATISSLIIYKWFSNEMSLSLLKTKKSFTFEADPYSGKVKCSY